MMHHHHHHNKQPYPPYITLKAAIDLFWYVCVHRVNQIS